MPQGKSNSKGGSSKSSSSTSSGGRSNNSYYQQYGGWPNFMHSYGLDTTSHSDAQEGRAILEGFKSVDRAQDSGE